jgi:hypothetical protein
LLNDIFKQFHKGHLLTTLIAVLGAAYIHQALVKMCFRVLITQGANLCFAVGQVAYKYLLKSELESTPKHTILDCFIGAFSSTNCFSILGSTEKMPTTSVQWEY